MHIVRTHRRFGRLLAALAASQLGDWLYNLALLAYVEQRSHSTTWLGLTTAARIAPIVVAGPVGGLIADRFDRRRVMIVSDALRAGTMGLLFAVAAAGLPVALVPLLAAVATLASVPYPPAVAAVTPRLVSDDDLAAANAARGSIAPACVAAGPALGAVLLVLGPAQLAFAVNAVTFVVSALLVASIPAGAEFAPARGDVAPDVGDVGAAGDVAETHAIRAALTELRAGARTLMRAPEAARVVSADAAASFVWVAAAAGASSASSCGGSGARSRTPRPRMSASSLPSTSRSAPTIGAYGSSDPPRSTQSPDRTRAPPAAARPANSATSRLLPTPDSPPISTNAGSPAAAPRASSASCASSRARPTNSGLATRTDTDAVQHVKRSIRRLRTDAIISGHLRMQDAAHPHTTGTEVVIIGGGPVGCALAIDLRLRGVRCVVVERDTEISYDMRAMNNDMRTMEWLRRWGIAADVRACNTVPPEFKHDLVFCTSLAGHELGVYRAYGFRPEEAHELAAEPGQPVSQKYTARTLRARAVALGAELLSGWECDGVEQSDGGVTARVVAADGSERRALRGAYLVGADGGKSLVRSEVGITRSGAGGLGKHVHAVVGVSGLLANVTVSPGCFYILFHPEVGGLVLPSEVDEFNLHLAGFAPDEDITGLDLERLARTAVGRDVEVEIRQVSPYLIHELIADDYRAGRVFIAGDAAHLFCPFGGFNMNTGIGDAGNLGWKLAAAVRGWGGEALLDSYGAERRPIALQNCAEATRNVHALVAAVGEVMAQGVPDGDSAGDDAERRRLGRHLYDATYSEWNTRGVVLDQRYTDSPVVVDDGSDAPAWDVTAYAPIAKPGHRAPHVWLQEGVALYDRLGPGLTLLDLGAGAAEVTALREAAHDQGVPFEVIAPSDGRVRELYRAPLVIVRPDQHVAWRGEGADDAAGLIGTIRGAAAVAQPA